MKKDVEHISVNTLRATFLSNRPEFSVMQLFKTFSETPVEESLC